jgi:hypothetical protein
MKKYLQYAIIFILVLTVFWPSPAYAKELFDDKVVFGGTYTLESGESLDGNLVIFGGAVTTEGESTVNGDVVLIGGVANIGGTVNGNFVGIGGAVQLTSSAVVNGDLVTIGATLSREEGARVNGQIVGGMGTPFIFDIPESGPIEEIPAIPEIPEIPEVPEIPEIPVVPPVPQPPRINFSFNPLLEILWFFFRTLMLALLAVLVVIFFEKPTSRVAKAAVEQPLITGGAGFLTAVLTPMALIALTLTIILIPVTILTILALIVAWLFGWIAVGLEVGRRIAKILNMEWALAVSAGIGAFLLFLVLGGFAFIPCIGWIPMFLVGLWGLGAVIMTRFGTQDYVPAGSTSGPPAPAEVVPQLEESNEAETVVAPIVEDDTDPDMPAAELLPEEDAGSDEPSDPQSDE